MTPDQVIALLARMVEMAGIVAGPVLGASLAAGLFIGILQTAMQINEPSVGFVVKVGAALAAMALLGSSIADRLLDYTRSSLEAIAHVAE
jgi:flagellar biosynthesis protein FliQ